MGVATNLVHTDHLVGCCVDRKRARLVDEGRELARHLHCQAGHEQQHDPRLGQKSAEARGRIKNHIEKRSLESRAAVALRDHVHRDTPAALRAPPEAPRCERLRICKTIHSHAQHALTASEPVGRPTGPRSADRDLVAQARPRRARRGRHDGAWVSPRLSRAPASFSVARFHSLHGLPGVAAPTYEQHHAVIFSGWRQTLMCPVPRRSCGRKLTSPPTNRFSTPPSETGVQGCAPPRRNSRVQTPKCAPPRIFFGAAKAAPRCT